MNDYDRNNKEISLEELQNHILLTAKYQGEMRTSNLLRSLGAMRIRFDTFRSISDLHRWVTGMQAFRQQHDKECSEGAVCGTHAVIDAAILAHFVFPWQIGMYADADRKDYLNFRKSVLAWKNYRTITEEKS
jgi:hypothetical protein